MRQLVDLPDLTVTTARDGPLILAGPPARLQGRLIVTNTGQRRSRLRGFAVQDHDLPGEPRQGRLVADVAPAASADVTASLELPARTPPGEYHGTLDVAGHPVQATLHVSAEPALTLSPTRVVLEAGTSRVQLVLHNSGNVQQQIAPVARARLDEDPDLLALPTARPPENDTADRGSGPDAVLRVPGPVGLDPGTTAVVDAEVEIAENLDGERRYLARLPVGTATLRVIVNPVAPGPAPKPRRSRTTPARRNDA